MNTVLNANMNESSNKLEKGFYPNTELGIDLKLIVSKKVTIQPLTRFLSVYNLLIFN